jgi:hypothetical protein
MKSISMDFRSLKWIPSYIRNQSARNLRSQKRPSTDAGLLERETCSRIPIDGYPKRSDFVECSEPSLRQWLLLSCTLTLLMEMNSSADLGARVIGFDMEEANWLLELSKLVGVLLTPD